MKKVFILLIGFSLCFISCSKKERNQTNETTIIQETKIEKEETSTEIKVEEKAKEYVYVNSVEGLRIRKNSDAESEKIGSLKNKEKVELISRGKVPVEIDGITSTWYEIKTEEGIQGFAFGGYLEETLNNVEIIQTVEGNYWDEQNRDNVTIINKGNGKLSVTTNIPIFSESQRIIEVQEIFHTDLFNDIIDGRGGLSNTFSIKFNENKELILQNDRYELINMFEDDEYERETHKTTVFIKK
ncbi:MAG TPA: hypothetical protein DCM57_06545 [Treponema sp.]|nr:hypothetical protein [Treponema sp.]